MKFSGPFPTPQNTGERGGAGEGSYTGVCPQGAISDQNFRILGPPPSLVCGRGVGGKTDYRTKNLVVLYIIRKRVFRSVFFFFDFPFYILVKIVVFCCTRPNPQN